MNRSRLKVTQVEPLAQRWIRVTFADGAVHDVDLSALLHSGGAFVSIRDDRAAFEAVAVDHDFGTVVWPGGTELDPDVLRGDQPPASGAALPRRIVQTA